MLLKNTLEHIITFSIIKYNSSLKLILFFWDGYYAGLIVYLEVDEFFGLMTSIMLRRKEKTRW